MTYKETLDYLFQQLPMYQRIGQAAYKADLQSTYDLMETIDHPEHAFKSVHIAGTNGKGSTAHLLASILQEAGYKTGLYTSPHLLDFRERIRINGKMIGEEQVVNFVNTYKPDFEPLELSFFEWSVGLAFYHFKQEKVDIAIIEVGMGGRLDSTNVINPEATVITNIGNDHAQFLGNTLDKIATEKAGTIKPKTPVIIGKSQRETEGMFRRIALSMEAPIIFADQQFPEDIPESPLFGAYQKENFQTVLVTCETLRSKGWNISDQSVEDGFAHVISNTGLRGRWEVVKEQPKVICDVGHNLEGVRHLVEQLETENYYALHLVLGFVSDKSVEDVLKLFPKDAKMYLCEPSIPRAMPIDRLSQIADESRIEHKAFNSVDSAYLNALESSKPADLIFVGGSTFVVADLLAHIQTNL